MKQFIETANRLFNEGEWVYNERTGTKCLTIINADFVYDVEKNEFPLETTRKCFPKPAFNELLGYLRGFSSAAQFREIGCNTWNANSNENKSWLNNVHRKCEDDMGRVYGVQGRDWRVAPSDKQYDELMELFESGDRDSFFALLNDLRANTVDQLTKVYNNLKNGIDDRGEIITFWNFTEFDQGCLRPCMFMHHFSILGGKLYLTSYQRSCDYGLGYAFNAPQCFYLLQIMAQITGLKPAKAFHKVVNLHLYENQIEPMLEQISRTPKTLPKLKINENIKTLEDVLTWVSDKDIEVIDYDPHPAIKFPFTV